MAKSERVNLSVPGPLYARFVELGRLTGLTVPGVMLHALVAQVTYMERQFSVPSGSVRVVPREAGVSDAQAGAAAASSGSGKGSSASGALSRQQRRAVERQGAKKKRS